MPPRRQGVALRDDTASCLRRWRRRCRAPCPALAQASATRSIAASTSGCSTCAEPAHAAGQIVGPDHQRIDAGDRDDGLDRLDRVDVLALQHHDRRVVGAARRTPRSRGRSPARARAPRRARRAAGTCRTTRSLGLLRAVHHRHDHAGRADVERLLDQSPRSPSGHAHQARHARRLQQASAPRAKSSGACSVSTNSQSKPARENISATSGARQRDDGAEQELAPRAGARRSGVDFAWWSMRDRPCAASAPAFMFFHAPSGSTSDSDRRLRSGSTAVSATVSRRRRAGSCTASFW